MILVCGFLVSQVSHAEEWTPFIGASLLPNANFALTEFDTTCNRKDNKLLTATTTFALSVNAGVEKEQLSLLAQYYISVVPGAWSDITYQTTNQEGPITQSIYELREWRENYIACGVRYSPILPEKAKSKLYLGGGVGIGRVAYKDRYKRIEKDGLISRTQIEREIEAETDYFFKPYAEAGISSKVGARTKMTFGLTGQYAFVSLDQHKQNPNIYNYVHHWMIGLEFGIQYYIK